MGIRQIHAITFDRVPIDEDDGALCGRGCRYHATPVASCSNRSCTEKVTTVYETLERPLVPVLAGNGAHGIKVDRDHCRRMSNAFAQKMAGLGGRNPRRWRAKASTSARPNSWARSCSTRWGWKAARREKTGAYSTGADILEDLATEHELPAQGAGLASTFQAEVDLYRRLAGPTSIRTRAGCIHLMPRPERQHRPPGLDRSEPAEHPGAHRGRPPHPRGISLPRTGQQAGQSRTTARLNCAFSPMWLIFRHAETGLCRWVGHSRHDRVRDVRCAAGRDDAGYPSARPRRSTLV